MLATRIHCKKMAVFIVCILLVALIALYILSINLYWKSRNVPYLIKYPLLASKDLLCLQISIGSYLAEVYNKSKDKLVGFHTLGQPCVLLKDPEFIKQILVKDFNIFAGRTLPTNFENDPVGGRVLFKLPSPEWKVLRTQISPAFSSGKLKHMYPKMVEVGRNFVEYIQDHEGEVMYVKELCGKYAVDVISSCGFCIEGNCFKDENALSIQAARSIFVCNLKAGIQFCCHFVAPALVKMFRMTFLAPSSIAFVETMFDDIKKYRSRQKANYMDFAETLLNILEGKKSTYEEVVAQAVQIWIAGFETVSSTISFGLYELARNKDVQQKLRSEIISTMMKYNGELNYDCLQSMQYLDMVVSETLRMYPSVPFADRKASDDYNIPGTNMMISKGTNVYVPFMGLHYDPMFFPDPHMFDPERFSSKNKQFIEPFSYLPFGDGPRNCLGMRFGKLSVKTALASILTNFEVEAVQYPGVKFDGRAFALVPETPIKLTFRRLCDKPVIGY